MLTNVTVTKVKQEANAVLNTEEKTLYYLIIGEGQGKAIINVGVKTYTTIAQLESKQSLEKK